MSEYHEYDNLRLDRQLCFALYAATHAITRAYRTRFSTLGLTYPQYLVLLALWESDGQTVRGLARRLQLDAATLTPLLKRLEESGLIERRRGVPDGRTVQALLTPRGHALRHQVAPLQREVTCQTGLGETDFEALRSTLHRLTGDLSVREHGQGPERPGPGDGALRPEDLGAAR